MNLIFFFQIDEGESCDVGLFFPNDRCCFSQNCTLKPGARCSNKNSPCCTDDCQVFLSMIRLYCKSKLELDFKKSPQVKLC